MSAKPTTIESNKRFSESKLWQIQRDYFEKQGVNAWVGQVPFYVTSNPFLCNGYADMIVRLIQDWTSNHPEARSEPFYIMELAAGTGQLSFYVIKRVAYLLKILKLDDVKVCYVMTDFTDSIVNFWRNHETLKPYVDKGMLDFAIYNCETDNELNLLHSGITLKEGSVKNPITVIANYIFDTVSHDAFNVRGGKVYELMTTLKTDADNMKSGKPMDESKIDVRFSIRGVEGDRYEDPALNAVLEDYKKLLHDSNILIPIAGIRSMQAIRRWSNDKVFLLASDKGYGTLQEIENLSQPRLVFHGSFSMMVNFDAVGRYFKHSGGDFVVQTQRKGLKTGVFMLGMTLDELPNTHLMAEDFVEGVSPADYFNLHRNISDTFQHCILDALASHMAFAGWDPHMFHRLCKRMCDGVPQADPSTIEYLAANLHKVSDNIYQIPSAIDVYFDVAFLLHTMKRFDLALKEYLKSEKHFGSQYNTVFNIGLCAYNSDDKPLALEYFKKALAINPSSKDAKQWVTHLEPAQQIAG